ncbi:MAG TPA: transcriptional regulator, partial [Clostridiales bacterium]|nr:transcriptional regulator [Clostridiales bacterium]
MKSRDLDSQKLLTENLEAVIESSYDGIFITDGKANVIYLNSAYERITGVRRNELLGKNMDNLVRDNIISRSATLIVLKEKKVTTISQMFKTGNRVLVTSTPIFNEDNEIILVVTNVRDVSELENLKSEVDKSDRLLKQYVSQIEEFKAQIVK